ncbi:hypothetical protein N5C72_24865 [Achromobacter mucicolens]|uniref:Uncharacterized protein n=1 Tax=Achromobacter mucicolens TaxID=1389922 RepID=A0ABD4Z417_9BURK|nr:hypothetical protein [Achromobacter mucicolens]MDH1181319.1 hypothetical protein [Achromobacter mucicolens]
METRDKRPLYFISSEDFYFFAYSILLTLEMLGGAAKRIKDHRKIAYLIQFISDSRLVDILDRTQGLRVANPVDRDLLFSSYTNAELHKREVYKILFSLRRKGFVSIERTDTAEILDVSLVASALPRDFLNSEYFEKERANAVELKRIIQRISMLTFETLLERLYKDRGVGVWAV